MNVKDYLSHLYFDKAGQVLEFGPLKYFGSGYWGERYARRSLKRIEEFEKSHDLDNIDISDKELENFYYDLFKDDLKSLGCWVGTLVIQLYAVTSLIKYVEETRGDFAAFSLLVPYAFLVEQYACSSAIRKYRRLMKLGEEELAAIITQKASGNKALKYFLERHPHLMQEAQELVSR